MKGLIIGVIVMPIAILMLVVIPMMGTTASADPCSPVGGAPLQVTAGDATAWGSYSAEQIKHAKIIVEVGAKRNIPPRGVQIALMTAIDESGLVPKKQIGMSATNPETAWGLFQQTPKYGWGTVDQVMDPVYATNAFYDRLVKVKGWEKMLPTLAAHAVQGNADPNVYTQFWDDAGELLAHLTAGSDSGKKGKKTQGRVQTVANRAPSSSLPTVRMSAANVTQSSEGIAKVQGSGVDFVALNETNALPPGRLAIGGYSAFRVEKGNAQERDTAVAWRSDRWAKVAGGRLLLIPSGPQKWDKGKSATWVTLRATDGSGAQVSVVSVHHMTDPRYHANQKERQAISLAAMKLLAGLVTQLSPAGPVLVGGDFNSEYRRNDSYGPRPVLASVGLQASFDVAGPVGTHRSGAVIDYVFAPTSVQVLGQRTMTIPGDHDALVVDLALTSTGGTLAVPLDAPVYCDSGSFDGESGGGTDGGGGGFSVNAVAKYVGPYSAAELVKRAKNFAAGGGGWLRKCQNFVAQLAGRSNSGYNSAKTAVAVFRKAGVFHEANSIDGYAPPVGAWLYYSGTSGAAKVYGHVVTYLGDGLVAGTDTWRSGYVDVGPASDITGGKWNLTYLGWAVPWASKSNDVAAKAPLSNGGGTVSTADKSGSKSGATDLPSQRAWLDDVTAALAGSDSYLTTRAKSGGKLAVVLDIDNTSIQTHYAWPAAIPQTLALVNRARALGMTVFFVTGRNQKAANGVPQAIPVLRNAGYSFERVCGRGDGEGLAASKKRCRKAIAKEGYTIVANVGNRDTDFKGGNYEKAYSLPNYGGKLS